MDQTGYPATPFGDGAYPEKPANKEVQRVPEEEPCWTSTVPERFLRQRFVTGFGT
jgi:hypothetical protein